MPATKVRKNRKRDLLTFTSRHVAAPFSKKDKHTGLLPLLFVASLSIWLKIMLKLYCREAEPGRDTKRWPGD
jgi:hypothetical protein